MRLGYWGLGIFVFGKGHNLWIIKFLRLVPKICFFLDAMIVFYLAFFIIRHLWCLWSSPFVYMLIQYQVTLKMQVIMHNGECHQDDSSSSCKRLWSKRSYDTTTVLEMIFVNVESVYHVCHDLKQIVVRFILLLEPTIKHFMGASFSKK